jgi:Putative MetA-pathway of phenol degradation
LGGRGYELARTAERCQAAFVYDSHHVGKRLPIIRASWKSAGTALLALAIAGTAFAQGEDLISADRPGIADSSTTIRRGAWQIEAGLERDDQTAERTLSTPALVRYGLSDAFELRLEGSGYQRVTAATSSSGWAPVSIGAKLHIMEEDAQRRRPSVGLIARVFVPSGSGEFRSTTATADLRLAADLDLNEHWSVNPNAGIRFDDDNGRFTAALAALTVQYNVSPRLNGFVDGGMQTPERRGGTSSLLVDAGVAWIVGRSTQLDASIGWGAHGETPPRVFWSAGLSRRF